LKLNSAACAGQRRIVGAAAAIVVPTSSVLRDNFIVISSLELESAADGCLSPRKVPVQRNPCQAALVIFAAKPAWWARSLYMYHTTATEPVGVILAMQTTQEGQMPGLIGEVLLPAFEKHYGFKRTAPEIEFFTEHDAADVEHSRRQIELCGRHLDTPQLEGRAEQVAQEICELRWASISELYRSEVLGEKEILPPGVG
jgi:hypothetical protein